MKRISNKNARKSVQIRTEFKGNNTYGMWHSDNKYVVYSYGSHFPLFVWYHGVWYENSDKYSTTTSKHRTQLHPLTDTVKYNTHLLKQIIYSTKL